MTKSSNSWCTNQTSHTLTHSLAHTHTHISRQRFSHTSHPFDHSTNPNSWTSITHTASSCVTYSRLFMIIIKFPFFYITGLILRSDPPDPSQNVCGPPAVHTPPPTPSPPSYLSLCGLCVTRTINAHKLCQLIISKAEQLTNFKSPETNARRVYWTKFSSLPDVFLALGSHRKHNCAASDLGISGWCI